MRPLIRSTLAGAVLLPAVFVLAGSAATAATASAHVPTVIVAVSHAAQTAPASPDPAMPGMDMSVSGGADTMPGMDMEPKTRSTDPAPAARRGRRLGYLRLVEKLADLAVESLRSLDTARM